MQAMGRKIGFIPAAVRLADPKRELPLQIYLTESKLTLADLADKVNDQLKQSGRCLVVVSEGFDVGDIGAQKDSFGHVHFGASDLTVQQAVVSYLNKKGLPTTGKARGQVPGTDQRHCSVLASAVDLKEAYESGRKAAEIAMKDGNGFMATILRETGATYKARYDKVPLEVVANSERFFPKEWIAANRIDVTDDFIRYAQPLIGEGWVQVPLENGLPRYARLKPIFVEKKSPAFLPEAYRKK
jgi:ATP-dependent phosphofructokinase / diphosphate-dependent phosphofructokinase